MPDPEEIAGRQELLAAHRERMMTCLKQIAMQGQAHAMPGLFAEIRTARAEIQHLKSWLRDAGTAVEDLPEDIQGRSELLLGRPIPRQLPPPPRHYVERQASAEALHDALLGADGQPLIILHGMSGTGKTSLAARVARDLRDDDFPDGILWGNLDNLTPNELLLSFLGALDSSWYHSGQRANSSLRKIFWQILADSNARALIVLDNVKESRQLVELLPNSISRVGRCRVLAIAAHKLNGLPTTPYDQPLSYFTEHEALDLFCSHLGPEKLTMHKEKLREISRRLEYLPQLLAAAAHDFATGKISPNAYVLMLRQGEGQSKLIGGAVQDSLDLTIRDLAPEQIVLFELIGVLGEGDWQDTMLATIALRPLSEVRRHLTLLVDYELIKRVSHNRYRANSLIREFARQRFRQRPEYFRHAAYTLLARYCLDAAQDLGAALLARPELRSAPGQPLTATDESFIQAFRRGLLPEMSHIREVLEWATDHEQWDILLRFSYVSSMELLKGFAANGYAIRMALRMATLVEPIIWLQGDRQRLECRSLITATNWTYSAPESMTQTVEQSLAAGQIHDVYDEAPDEQKRCELSLEITAGQIIDGVLDTMILADARWIGVRASGLLCRTVDIVGGRFIACDLSQGVYIHCDARRATLLGSNMSHALLRWVKLQGANLQGLNLAGAVLEHVDLRGADLREANLIGAVLEHVDLRGADLREANLIGAVLKEVNASGADLRDANCSLVETNHLMLSGCRIERTRWAGAKTHGISFEDKSFLVEIELAAAEQPDTAPIGSQRGRRPSDDLPKGSVPNLEDADLRGAELKHCPLMQANLRGADLRAAILEEANLSNSLLDNADLRAADLKSADLTNASLRGANLYAAVLANAYLEKTDLGGAIVHSAYLAGAQLPGANLSATRLSAACLNQTNLRSALLKDADLSRASLKAAKLGRAILHRANLTSADLTDADLTDADLTDAIFVKARLTGAVITDAQLAQARNLGGAILPDGQVVCIFDGIYGTESSSHDVDMLRVREIGQLDEQRQRRDFLPGAFLRFAQCDGTFDRIDLAERDLAGARLTGKFDYVNLSQAKLVHAILSGALTCVNLAEANLTNARISGECFELIFRSADFQGASLRGASLVNCDLRGARNLSTSQLRQALRLRGSILPDGSPYDNRFNLAGDREDAPYAGVNPHDRAAMAAFCSNTAPTYNPTA